MCLLLAYFSEVTAETRRYRLSWREDPATSMVIGFEWKSGERPMVVFDDEDHGSYTAAYQFRQQPDEVVMAKGVMRTCFVRLKNLRPGTVYYFLVVDSEGQSRPLSFETAPNRPSQRLSLIAGGDSRNHRSAAQAANRLVSRLRPHAVLFGGDMTAGDTPAEWRDWLDDWQLTISRDGRCYPIIAARGNHESSNQSLIEMLDLPTEGNYYAFNLGGSLLRTYTLNSLAPADGAQRQWLEQDLRRHTATTWRIAQYHHAMRPHTMQKPERDDLARLWAPLFFQHKVQLAIESDSHVAKITWPIIPARSNGQQGFVRDDQRGTVYIGEGCWGAPLRSNDDDKRWTRASGSFNQFKWIWIDQNQIEIRTLVIDRSHGETEVNPARRFTVPPGVQLWETDGTRVVTVNQRPANQQVASADNRPAPQTTRPAIPVRVPPPPVQPQRVRPNSDWRVKLDFELAQSGAVDIIVIDERMREFFRHQSPVMGAGPYSEWLQLPEIPRGAHFQLLLKSSGQIIARYELVN